MEENSLRLRLKQKEVDEFYSQGRISSTTRLGVQPENALRFTLIRDSAANETSVSFEGKEIRVRVPEIVANHWTQTDEEGFQSFMPVEENQQLHIIVEKDFRCLHKGPYNKEDEDSFPNPLENGKRC